MADPLLDLFIRGIGISDLKEKNFSTAGSS